jgi:signal peptidase I
MQEYNGLNENMDEVQQPAPENGGKGLKKEIMEWVFSIAIAVIIALVIRQFIFTVVRVEGSSMLPTLTDNDRLIVWRLGYKPEANDIIVLHQEDHLPYIKRVIATEGQTVDINFNTHKVYVDGKLLDEPFIYQPTSQSGDVQFPVTVDEDCVFVLGDNRNNSRDSRFSDVGMVSRDDIIGKAVLRFFPFSEFGTF